MDFENDMDMQFAIQLSLSESLSESNEIERDENECGLCFRKNVRCRQDLQ